MRYIIVLSCLLFLLSCKNSESSVNESEPSHTSMAVVAAEKLGNKYACNVNSANTFTVCFAERKEEKVAYLTFIVYDHLNQKLSYQAKDRVREVTWESDDVLRVERLTGMPKEKGVADFFFLNVATNKISASYSKP